MTPTRSKPRLGWPLLPVPDGGGELSWPSLEESVRQGIEVILRTKPGEQLMRPNYGGGLEELLHEPNNLTTRRRLRDLVTSSLERFEPRLVLDRVDVWEVPGEPTRVRLEIGYRLRRTGTAQQLAVTLDMAG